MPWSDKIDANSILINPSLAFGTGHHQTTQSCIKILSRLKDENFNPKTALDIGTGTEFYHLFAENYLAVKFLLLIMIGMLLTNLIII